MRLEGREEVDSLKMRIKIMWNYNCSAIYQFFSTNIENDLPEYKVVDSRTEEVSTGSLLPKVTFYCLYDMIFASEGA